jgi:hypothetical protein
MKGWEICDELSSISDAVAVYYFKALSQRLPERALENSRQILDVSGLDAEVHISYVTNTNQGY